MAAGPMTSRAIAYLKPDLTGKPRLKAPRRRVELSGPDAPVLRPLTDGLLVAYVVDQGDHFEFVQHRHLEEEGCSEEELHTVAVENLARQASGSLQVARNSEVFAVLMGGNFEASLRYDPQNAKAAMRLKEARAAQEKLKLISGERAPR